MRHGLAPFAPALLLFSILPASISAQTIDQGTNPYSSLHGGDLDSVVLSSGSLLLHIPLISYPQRGKLHLGFFIAYDNQSFTNTQVCTTYCSTFWSIRGDGVHIMSDLPYTNYLTDTNNNKHYYAITPDGSTHRMESTSDGLLAVNATGFHFNATSQVMIDRDGIRYSGNTNSEWPFGPPGQVEDPNGNLITTNYAGGDVALSITDSVGRSIPIPPEPFDLQGSDQTTDFSSCTGPLTTTTAYLWSPPGPDGGTSVFKACFASVPVYYNPGGCTLTVHCYPVNFSTSMLQSIVLPNLTAWTFQYDTLGDLSEITLPTGGTISYTWGLNNSKKAWTPPIVSPCVVSRSVNSNDGTGSHTWTYGGDCGQAVSPPQLVTVTDPVGNQTVHSFNFFGSTNLLQGPVYETEAQYYQGSSASGTLLKTVNTNYSYNTSTLFQLTTINVVPSSVTTTWPSGKVNQTQKTYDTGFSGIILGQVLEQRDYDYGNGAPGPLLRRTDTTYMAVSGSSYLTNNLLTLPNTVITYNGAGTQLASTTFAYDGSALVSSGITTQHDASPPDGAYRGNQTSITRWVNSPSGNLISTKIYYDTGELQQSITPKQYPTTYTYACTGAYLLTVKNALNQVTTYNPDCNTGLNLSVTDPNNQTTNYTYDAMWRLATASYPDGGLDSITHQEVSYPFTATLTKKITSSLNYVKTNVFDGLGRLTQSQLTSDPQGTDYALTTYDALGHVASVTNPYRTTSDPTYGLTQNQYDALNRTTLITKPDGSTVQTAYCGPTTLVTDEANHWRRSTADGLGRLIEVDEPNSTTASVNVCPGTGEPIWVTAYTYDALNNLASVTQGGSRNRSFVFDSISRMTSSNNPESGTVTYTYDGDNNVSTKADARGVTITYSYDSLDRLTGRTYSNGDPTVTYAYDQSTCIGQSPCYNVGRRTSVADAAGTESLSYDTMGREWGEQRTTNSITKTTDYAYNFDGSLSTLTYPSGRVITYTPDSVGRPSLAQDVTNSINYALGTCANGTGSNGVCYAPQGAVASYIMGQTGSFAGINFSATYNNRLEPNEFKASSSASSLFDLTYCFYALVSGACPTPPQTGNNGNVTQIANNLNGNRTQQFSYDQVNRIVTGGTTSSCSSNCWSQAFGYDQWANLLTATATGSAPPLSLSVNANNQITTAGFDFDAAGNETSDVTTTYAFNAESEIKSAGGVNYTYDGDGNRVQKSNGKIYWYGAGTEILDESDLSGNITDEYVFFGGKRVAHRNVSSGNIYYYAEDLLGSSRVIATSAGALCYDADFYPYGGEDVFTNTCPQNYKFEGKERDTETGNDDFGARYYSSVYGRWLSPDWSAVPAPVPYANLTNPQTLNLYAMVSDNPESFADLDGHFRLSLDDWYAQSTNEADNPPQLATAETVNTMTANGQDQQQQHGWIWKVAHALGIVHTPEESAAIARQDALRFFKTSHLILLDEHGHRVDPATLSTQQLQAIQDEFWRSHCPMPMCNPGMLGWGGTRVTSHTLWESEGSHIDVENPNPGQRPGQIHFQDASGSKYLYDLETKSFRGAPNAVNELLGREDVQRAIQTGLKYLGVSE